MTVTVTAHRLWRALRWSPRRGEVPEGYAQLEVALRFASRALSWEASALRPAFWLAKMATIRAAKAVKATTMSTTTVADRIPAREPQPYEQVAPLLVVKYARADFAGAGATSMTDRHYTM